FLPPLFHANDRRLAAYPALFSGGELRRQDQHQLNIGAALHTGLRVKENSIRADVAGLGRLFVAAAAHASRHACSDSASSSAFPVWLHEGKNAHIIYTKAENLRSFMDEEES